MKTARLKRYVVITRLSRSGLSPRLFAIAGIDTAIIVESSPSIKNAQPTISGMRIRSLGSAMVGKAGVASLKAAAFVLGRYDCRGPIPGGVIGFPARSRPQSRPDCMTDRTEAAIDPALIENWALSYLGRFASSVENLRRVLRRRARRRFGGEAAGEAEPLIEALIARYRESGLLDDAAYAAARARARPARGEPVVRIAAGL